MRLTKPQLVALGVLLLAIVVGGGLFSVISAQEDVFECVFERPGDTCVYNVTLSSERAMSLYTLEFEWDAVADAELRGYTQLSTVATTTSTATRSTGVGRTDYFTWYLHPVPSTWESDIYSVYVEMSGDVELTCRHQGLGIRSFAYLGGVTQPYPFDVFRKCNREQCLEDDTNFLIREYTDNFGNMIVNARNQQTVISSQVAGCWLPSGESVRVDEKSYYFEGTIPLNSMHGEDTKIITNMVHAWERSQSSQRNSRATHTPPVVMAGYYRALRPTNVAYAVGDFPVETLSGVQKEPYTTLDISQQINLACNRGISVAECVVPITLTSQQAGIVRISEGERTLRVASESALAEELNLAQLTLEQQREYIKALDASIAEKAALIESLELTRQEQMALVADLELSISEQGELINELQFNLDEKISYAQSLEASIAEQAALINVLAGNLDEKAAMVSELTAENAVQAELIRQMEQSFANQGGIIVRLNNTVLEDAEIIRLLSAEFSDQGEIIRGMQQTIARDADLISALTSELDEQAVIISKLRKNSADQAELVSRLRTNLDEQAELIELLRAERRGQNVLLSVLALLLLAVVGGFFFFRGGRKR